MIPESITEDLKAGLSLEDALRKHGTNLQELFKNNPHREPVLTDWTYIQQTEHGSFRVYKTINNCRFTFGTYSTHEDALIVRNELIKCGWDKEKLESIQQYKGIIPNIGRVVKIYEQV